MLSVKQRLKNISQPDGGYVPKNLFVEHQYRNFTGITEIETAFSSIQGLTVDYLTRYMLSNDKLLAFGISICGAKNIDKVFENDNEYSHIMDLLDDVVGLDDNSIYNACQIVGYDVALRQGVEFYQNVNNIVPTENLINNIRTMVMRCLYFLNDVGPVISDGFNFDGGYTGLVSKGDGDYLTHDMLIDFKVSKQSLSTEWSLQLLMYYLLGVHSVHSEFKSINKLCVFNPYENKSYIVKLSDISDESKYKVSHDVLGYKMVQSCFRYDSKSKRFINDFSPWLEVDGTDLYVLKRFLTANMNTNFKIDDYKDGIHDIAVDDYWTYLRNIDDDYKFKLRPVFKHTNYIKMIKRNGFVMFMSVSHKGSLCILNGARLKKADFSPEYYFENLERYANSVVSMFSKYWETLYKISEQITSLKPDKTVLRKRDYAKYVRECKLKNERPLKFNEWYELEGKTIKLSGRVHGCIVDVDYYNHIYLNPYDGTIVPYRADSMYDKDVYKNTLSLISAQRPEMLKSFNDLTENQSMSLLCADNDVSHELLNPNDEVSTEFVKVYSHDMYGISNRLKPLQNIYDKKLIQVWYDEFLDGLPTLLKNKRSLLSE